MANVTKLVLRWKEVLAITFVIRLFLITLPTLKSFSLKDIFYHWVQWDGPHYIDIARNWYQSQGHEALWIVFYPFYPFVIRLFNFLINDYYISAVIISIIFSFTASIFLFELTLLDYSKRVALLSVWFLNIFPTSFFLQASYTESIFLTVSIGTIYFFRKQNFILSGIFGLISTMTRINGLLLLPLLFLEMKKKGKSFITFFLTILGFLFYLWINYKTFGNPFYFSKPLSENWYKHFSLPWVGIKNLINFFPIQKGIFYYLFSAELIAILFILLFTIFVYLKIRRSYGIYMFLNLLLFTSTSFIMSTPRYALILFPIYILLGKNKNIPLYITASVIFMVLLLWLSMLYVRGEWAF